MAVLGAGNNDKTGPEFNNQLNAAKAAELINAGLANPNLVFTLGKGPEDIPYPTTEAEYLAEEISKRIEDRSPHFEMDTRSTTSAGNILQLANLIRDYNVERIGLVCIPWQDQRVVSMARMALGSGIEVEAYPSESQRTKVGIAKEKLLYGIFQASRIGLEQEGLEPYEQAIQRYERAIRAGKKTAVRVVNSPLAAKMGFTATTRY